MRTSNELDSIEVPGLTLSSLLENHQVKCLDYLIIDTEGYDGKIVEMALRLPRQPSGICFEHVHLSAQDRADVYRNLSESRYRCLHDKMNTLALKDGLI